MTLKTIIANRLAKLSIEGIKYVDAADGIVLTPAHREIPKSDSSVIIDGEGVLSSLMKEEAGVFIEAVDEIAAAEVEKAIRKYGLRKPSEKVFVIETENIVKCRTALKKKGIFPKDFISEEKQMEETTCEYLNFRR